MDLKAHFVEEHVEKAEKELICIRYCSLQIINQVSQGNMENAKRFQADVMRSLSELERMAAYKKDVDQAVYLLKQIEAQQQVNTWKKQFV